MVNSCFVFVIAMCALRASWAQSITAAHLDEPPRIFPMKDEWIIEAGSTLKIRCSGHSPVHWIVPEDEQGSPEKLSDRISVTYEEVPGDNPRPYEARLEAVRLHYLDTGYFYCRYNASSYSTDIGIGRTYVFVSDETSLFDTESRLVFVNVPQYQETMIPCRPTHPDVQMTFFKVESAGEDPDNITDSLETMMMNYYPKRGLIIERGTAFHSGALTCTATLDGKSEKLTAILTFQPDPGVVPTPFIQKPTTDTIYVGANVSLSCQLPVDHIMPHIDLVWNFPHKNIEEEKKSGRIVIEDQTRERIKPESQLSDMYPNSDVMISKTVLIDPVEETDVGEYNCTAVMKRSQTRSKPHKYLLEQILNREQAFIGTPKFHGDRKIVVASEKKISWVFDLHANPEPDYSWIHPKGEEINYRELEKYKLDVDFAKYKYTLSINNVDLEDTGDYLFEVEVEDSEGTVLNKSIELTLEFIQAPEIDIDVDGPRGALFVTYELKCNIKGFPINTTSLKWKFTRCETRQQCEEEGTVIPPDHFGPFDGNVLGDTHYEYLSRLNWKATESGFFTCEICTLAKKLMKIPSKCFSTTLEFFITDYSDSGFYVDPFYETEAIEGDSLNMTCSASVYNYTGVQWLFSKESTLRNSDQNQSLDFRAVQKTPSIFVKEYRTNFSHVSELNFDGIKLENKGSFKCIATPLNSRAEVAEERSFDLTVLSIKPPVKDIYNNMNGSEITLETSSKFSLNCSVIGRPTPKIMWTKDSVPLTIEDIQNSTTLDLSKDGQNLYIRFAVIKDTGFYTCNATNRGGKLVGSLKIDVLAQDRIPKIAIAIFSAGSIFIIILCGILCWKVKVYDRKYKELTKAELDMFIAGDPEAINPDLAVDDQADLLPYNREYEFSRDKLKLGKQLGAGAFGRVVKAQAFGIVSWERSTTVAVKMVKPHADIDYIRALMSELKIMIHLGKHLNIVNLLGACTGGLGKRELLVIVEYCRFGNLQKYLLMHRNNFINQIDPATKEVNFQIGLDIMMRQLGHDDLPRAREEDELSAAYANRNLNLSTTDGIFNSASGMNRDSGNDFESNGNPLAEGVSTVSANGGRDRRQPSIRYIDDPVTHAASGNMVVRKNQTRRPMTRQRQISEVSDYNDGQDQIVLTDMTTVPLNSSSGGGGDSTDGASIDEKSGHVRYSRSVSSAQGPGWRSNVRGDYDSSMVRPISTKDLICWGYQIARGMEYMASKKVMHGDLACRNILLAADNVVKICDFGLAKDIYKTNNYRKKTDGPLPVKWMAIESLRDRVFSTQSDVWAFGIVLWEMFTLGKTPYPGIEGYEVVSFLQDGKRMEKPDFCPMVIYRTMNQCWEADPNDRPSFTELMKKFGDLLEDGERDHYLDLSKQFEMINSKHAVENKDYLSRCSAPDYNRQMNPLNGDTIIEEELEEDEGYLVPTKSPLEKEPVGPDISEEGYLLPKEHEKANHSHSANRPNYLQMQLVKKPVREDTKGNDDVPLLKKDSSADSFAESMNKCENGKN